MLEVTVIVALFAAFLVLFISRFEVRQDVSIREWLQTRSPRLVADMLRCDFCLCWWVCLALSLPLAIPFGWVALVAAPLATPIARFLL